MSKEDQQTDAKRETWQAVVAMYPDSLYSSHVLKAFEMTWKAATAAARTETPQDEWVEINGVDDLPTENGWYLVTRFGLVETVHRTLGAEMNDRAWLDYTAWMPLPAPYTPPSKEQGGSKR